MKLKIGDRVIKNEEMWNPNEFDSWGRGDGIGEVLEIIGKNTVDVQWPNGKCHESVDQLMVDEHANVIAEWENMKHHERWDKFRKMKNRKIQWACMECRTIDESKPQHAPPFSGSSRHCGNCERELTHRTGGGMGDPFRWYPVPTKEKK